MKITIKAKANAKVEKIEELHSGSASKSGQHQIPSFKVSVKATPTDGKANDAIIRILATYFQVSRSQVRIVAGHSATQKIVEIIDY